MRDILRRCRFTPYRRGEGPTFSLTTWDTHSRMNTGQWRLGYELKIHDHGETWTLFYGEDYGCAPSDAVDSDNCIRGLMTFLTLRPGDTDSEYFEKYTQEQLFYCDRHAEYLGYEVMRRFGED